MNQKQAFLKKLGKNSGFYRVMDQMFFMIDNNKIEKFFSKKSFFDTLKINMILLTETAAKKIKSLKEEEKKDSTYFLRISVKKGGCSGLSYKMEFDHQIREFDRVFEQNDERIVVDSEAFLYLVGLTLDYSGGLNGKGFVFHNPNAKKSCSCGVSFNI